MVESSGSSPFLPGSVSPAALGTTYREKEAVFFMKRQRDLHVSLDCIQTMLTQDGLEPEQKDALVKTLKGLKDLRRDANPSKRAVYRFVRIITEDLVKSFIKRK